MHPIVRGALAATVLIAIAGLAYRRTEAPSPAPAAPVLTAPCGPGMLPDGPMCVPFPAGGARPRPPDKGAPRSAVAPTDIPRRPDRPADYTAYLLPVREGDARVVAGFGAPPPPTQGASALDELEARTAGVHVETSVPTAAVTVPTVEGAADGAGAEVAFVGNLAGVTVATIHEVAGGDRPRRYLVLFGGLTRPGPGVVTGARVRPGDVLGFARAIGGQRGRFYVETRLLREGVAGGFDRPQRLVDDAVGIAVDPRNVLGLK
jgi:hypothetical protein